MGDLETVRIVPSWPPPLENILSFYFLCNSKYETFFGIGGIYLAGPFLSAEGWK
jgi:hypothetical protein